MSLEILTRRTEILHTQATECLQIVKSIKGTGSTLGGLLSGDLNNKTDESNNCTIDDKINADINRKAKSEKSLSLTRLSHAANLPTLFPKGGVMEAAARLGVTGVTEVFYRQQGELVYHIYTSYNAICREMQLGNSTYDPEKGMVYHYYRCDSSLKGKTKTPLHIYGMLMEKQYKLLSQYTSYSSCPSHDAISSSNIYSPGCSHSGGGCLPSAIGTHVLYAINGDELACDMLLFAEEYLLLKRKSGHHVRDDKMNGNDNNCQHFDNTISGEVDSSFIRNMSSAEIALHQKILNQFVELMLMLIRSMERLILGVNNIIACRGSPMTQTGTIQKGETRNGSRANHRPSSLLSAPKHPLNPKEALIIISSTFHTKKGTTVTSAPLSLLDIAEDRLHIYVQTITSARKEIHDLCIQPKGGLNHTSHTKSLRDRRKGTSEKGALEEGKRREIFIRKNIAPKCEEALQEYRDAVAEVLLSFYYFCQNYLFSITEGGISNGPINDALFGDREASPCSGEGNEGLKGTPDSLGHMNGENRPSPDLNGGACTDILNGSCRNISRDQEWRSKALRRVSDVESVITNIRERIRLEVRERLSKGQRLLSSYFLDISNSLNGMTEDARDSNTKSISNLSYLLLPTPTGPSLCGVFSDNDNKGGSQRYCSFSSTVEAVWKRCLENEQSFLKNTPQDENKDENDDDHSRIRQELILKIFPFLMGGSCDEGLLLLDSLKISSGHILKLLSDISESKMSALEPILPKNILSLTSSPLLLMPYVLSSISLIATHHLWPSKSCGLTLGGISVNFDDMNDLRVYDDTPCLPVPTNGLTNGNESHDAKDEDDSINVQRCGLAGDVIFPSNGGIAAKKTMKKAKPLSKSSGKTSIIGCTAVDKNIDDSNDEGKARAKLLDILCRFANASAIWNRHVVGGEEVLPSQCPLFHTIPGTSTEELEVSATGDTTTMVTSNPMNPSNNTDHLRKIPLIFRNAVYSRCSSGSSPNEKLLKGACDLIAIEDKRTVVTAPMQVYSQCHRVNTRNIILHNNRSACAAQGADDVQTHRHPRDPHPSERQGALETFKGSKLSHELNTYSDGVDDRVIDVNSNIDSDNRGAIALNGVPCGSSNQVLPSLNLLIPINGNTQSSCAFPTSKKSSISKVQKKESKRQPQRLRVMQMLRDHPHEDVLTSQENDYKKSVEADENTSKFRSQLLATVNKENDSVCLHEALTAQHTGNIQSSENTMCGDINGGSDDYITVHKEYVYLIDKHNKHQELSEQEFEISSTSLEDATHCLQRVGRGFLCRWKVWTLDLSLCGSIKQSGFPYLRPVENNESSIEIDPYCGSDSLRDVHTLHDESIIKYALRLQAKHHRMQNKATKDILRQGLIFLDRCILAVKLIQKMVRGFISRRRYHRIINKDLMLRSEFSRQVTQIAEGKRPRDGITAVLPDKYRLAALLITSFRRRVLAMRRLRAVRSVVLQEHTRNAYTERHARAIITIQRDFWRGIVGAKRELARRKEKRLDGVSGKDILMLNSLTSVKTLQNNDDKNRETMHLTTSTTINANVTPRSYGRMIAKRYREMKEKYASVFADEISMPIASSPMVIYGNNVEGSVIELEDAKVDKLVRNGEVNGIEALPCFTEKCNGVSTNTVNHSHGAEESTLDVHQLSNNPDMPISNCSQPVLTSATCNEVLTTANEYTPELMNHLKHTHVDTPKAITTVPHIPLRANGISNFADSSDDEDVIANDNECAPDTTHKYKSSNQENVFQKRKKCCFNNTSDSFLLQLTSYLAKYCPPNLLYLLRTLCGEESYRRKLNTAVERHEINRNNNSIAENPSVVRCDTPNAEPRLCPQTKCKSSTLQKPSPSCCDQDINGPVILDESTTSATIISSPSVILKSSDKCSEEGSDPNGSPDHEVAIDRDYALKERFSLQKVVDQIPQEERKYTASINNAINEFRNFDEKMKLIMNFEENDGSTLVDEYSVIDPDIAAGDVHSISPTNNNMPRWMVEFNEIHRARDTSKTHHGMEYVFLTPLQLKAPTLPRPVLPFVISRGKTNGNLTNRLISCESKPISTMGPVYGSLTQKQGTRDNNYSFRFTTTFDDFVSIPTPETVWSNAAVVAQALCEQASVFAWRVLFSRTAFDMYKQEVLAATNEEKKDRYVRVYISRNGNLLRCYRMETEENWLESIGSDIRKIGDIYKPPWESMDTKKVERVPKPKEEIYMIRYFRGEVESPDLPDSEDESLDPIDMRNEDYYDYIDVEKCDDEIENERMDVYHFCIDFLMQCFPNCFSVMQQQMSSSKEEVEERTISKSSKKIISSGSSSRNSDNISADEAHEKLLESEDEYADREDFHVADPYMPSYSDMFNVCTHQLLPVYLLSNALQHFSFLRQNSTDVSPNGHVDPLLAAIHLEVNSLRKGQVMYGPQSIHVADVDKHNDAYVEDSLDPRSPNTMKGEHTSLDAASVGREIFSHVFGKCFYEQRRNHCLERQPLEDLEIGGLNFTCREAQYMASLPYIPEQTDF